MTPAATPHAPPSTLLRGLLLVVVLLLCQYLKYQAGSNAQFYALVNNLPVEGRLPLLISKRNTSAVIVVTLELGFNLLTLHTAGFAKHFNESNPKEHCGEPNTQ